MILKSRYVVPVDAPAIVSGAVVVRDGRIAAVGATREAREFQDGDVTDFGDAVICPGFVTSRNGPEIRKRRIGKTCTASRCG